MSEPQPTNPVRRRRWVLRLSLVLLAAFVLLASFRGVETLIDRRTRDAYAAELDERQRPWRLEEIEQERAAIPDDANSALVVIAADALLPASWPPDELDWHLHGGSRGRGRMHHPRARQFLAQELAAHRQALEKARTIRDLPAGRFRLKLDQTTAQIHSDDHRRAVKVALLLQCDAILRAQQQDLAGALDSCRAIVNVARSIGDEPSLDGQGIRGLAGRGAVNVLELVLGMGEAKEDQLRQMQFLLAEDDVQSAQAIVSAWRGHRALEYHRYQELASGRLSLSAFREETESKSGWSVEPYLGWLWWRSLPDEHLLVLKVTTEAIEIARLPMHEQAEAEEELGMRLETAGSWRLRREGRGVGLFSTMGNDHRLARTELRIGQVLLAAERYRLREGAWPAELGRLVPKYLPAVPLDPYDGKPLRHLRKDGEFVVYSVGHNRKDDGGETGSGQFPPDVARGLIDIALRRRP